MINNSINNNINQALHGDFTKSKLENKKYYEYVNNIDRNMIDISVNMIDRISTCGDFLIFLIDKNLEHYKVENSNMCRNRLCPRCTYLKARKDGIILAKVIEYIKQLYNYSFLFVTLTIPNVTGQELNETIKKLNKACTKMFNKNKKINAISHGYYKKLEITYNPFREDYHPHLHLLVAVNQSYFKSKQYLNKKEWLYIWQQAYKDENITQVDVRKAKFEEDDSFKSILELAKYTAKSSDYLQNGLDVFITFFNTLKGKRLFSCSGVFKEGFNMEKQGLIDNILGEDNIEYIYKLEAIWSNNQYNIDKIEEIQTEKEG